jgi:hypothetical protein
LGVGGSPSLAAAGAAPWLRGGTVHCILFLMPPLRASGQPLLAGSLESIWEKTLWGLVRLGPQGLTHQRPWWGLPDRGSRTTLLEWAGYRDRNPPPLSERGSVASCHASTGSILAGHM